MARGSQLASTTCTTMNAFAAAFAECQPLEVFIQSRLAKCTR